jgi:uncharacterized membrane protein YhaH (DUF805 family)
MRGNVIGFDPDTNTGAISGHDGNRYDFAMVDWRGENRPLPGDIVDFRVEGQQARQIFMIAPEYVEPTWAQAFFSFRGRFSRSDYWVKNIILQTVIFSIYSIAFLLAMISAGGAALGGSKALAMAFGIIPAIISLAALWPVLAILVKRIHDRNKSGWLSSLIYIPLLFYVISLILLPIVITVLLSIVWMGIGIWFFVEFGCMRGTVGPNRYGADPVFGLLMRVYGHMVIRVTDASRS